MPNDNQIPASPSVAAIPSVPKAVPVPAGATFGNTPIASSVPIPESDVSGDLGGPLGHAVLGALQSANPESIPIKPMAGAVPVPTGATFGDIPTETFWDKAEKLITGPNTAAGAPLSPKMQEESQGIKDVLTGSFSKGGREVWDAEKPHVIQGSKLEKMIKIFDPSFVGSISPEEAQIQKAQQYAPIENPAIDAAQFIDKQKHPMLKALTEDIQSFTSPANIAMLYSTGGLGLIKNPASLALANRLMAAGFSANAIGNAYNHIKSFAKAFEDGDENEAEYQLTHAVVSGALSTATGEYAVTGKAMPLTNKVPIIPLSAEDTEILNQHSEVAGLDATDTAKALQAIKNGLPVQDAIYWLRSQVAAGTAVVGKLGVKGATEVGRGVGNLAVDYIASKIRGEAPTSEIESALTPEQQTALDKITETFQQADQARASEGAKTTIGRQVSKNIRKILRNQTVTGGIAATTAVATGIIDAAKARLTPEQRAAGLKTQATSLEEGVPLSVGQASGIRGIKTVENILEDIPIVNKPFKDLDIRQKEALQTAADNLALTAGMAGRSDTVPAWNASERGEAIQRTFARTQIQAYDNFAKYLGSLDTAKTAAGNPVGDIPIDLQPIKNYAQFLQESEGQAADLKGLTSANHNQLMDILSNFAGKDAVPETSLPLMQMIRLSSKLSSIANDMKDTVDGWLLKQLDNKVADSIQKTLQNNNLPVLEVQYRAIRENLNRITDLAQHTILSKVIAQSPADAAAYLVRNGRADVMEAAATLAGDQLLDLRRAVAGEIFHSVLDNNDGLLTAKGLQAEWNKFGDGASAQALFGRAMAARMEGILDLAKRADLAPDTALKTISNKILEVGEAFGAAASLSHPMLWTIGAAGVLARGLGHILTNETGQDMLTHYLSGDKSLLPAIASYIIHHGNPPQENPPKKGEEPSGGAPPTTPAPPSRPFGGIEPPSSGGVGQKIQEGLFGKTYGGADYDVMKNTFDSAKKLEGAFPTVQNQGENIFSNPQNVQFANFLVAVHEAVHAAIYKELGMGVKSVSSQRTGSTAGTTQADFPAGQTSDIPAFINRAAARLTAAIAPTIYLKSRLGNALLNAFQLDHLHAAQDDFITVAKIREALDNMGGDVKTQIMKKVAANIQKIMNPDFENKVNAITKKLWQTGSLTGQELNKVLESVPAVYPQQGGHAGNGVASEEELSRQGRFVAVNPKNGEITDQGKSPDFNEGMTGYQVMDDGTIKLAAGQENPITKTAVQNYIKERFGKNIPKVSSGIQTSIAQAGGIYRGSQESIQGGPALIHIDLPRNLVDTIPSNPKAPWFGQDNPQIAEAMKNHVSIAMPADEITPESVTEKMNQKIQELGGISPAPKGPNPKIVQARKMGRDIKEAADRDAAARGDKEAQARLDSLEATRRNVARRQAQEEALAKKFPDKEIRSIIRANGENFWEKTQHDMNLARILHSWTAADLKDALGKTGYNMGDQVIGAKGMPRIQAWDILFKRISPQEAVKLIPSKNINSLLNRPDKLLSLENVPRAFDKNLSPAERAAELEKIPGKTMGEKVDAWQKMNVEAYLKGIGTNAYVTLLRERLLNPQIPINAIAMHEAAHWVMGHELGLTGNINIGKQRIAGQPAEGGWSMDEAASKKLLDSQNKNDRQALIKQGEAAIKTALTSRGLGVLMYGKGMEHPIIASERSIDESVLENIEKAVEAATGRIPIWNELLPDIMKTLIRHEKGLDAVAQALVDRKSLTNSQAEEIYNKAEKEK